MRRELVVATYNIQRGRGLDLRRDLDRTASVLSALGADVVALQEVLRGDEGDQAATLAARLGMQVVRCDVRPLRSSMYGNAVLSRLPVRGAEICDLSVAGRERRACVRVDVETGGELVHVFAVHLGLGLAERRAQMERLRTFLRASAGRRVVVGDFNEWHQGPVSRGLAAELGACARPRTHPALLPMFRLDRVAWDERLRGEIEVHARGAARIASDHLPVVARLAW